MWNYDLQTTAGYIYENEFTNINLSTVLYLNTEWDSYKTWLSTQASTIIDETYDNLTSALLTSFQSHVNQYDGWAIHVELSYDNISVTNQERAFCIEETIINNGISCAAVSTGSSTIEI